MDDETCKAYFISLDEAIVLGGRSGLTIDVVEW